MLYRFLKQTVGIIFKLIYKIDVENIENIPQGEKLIVCSNHIHNFDPIILSIIIRDQVFWMGKKELFENKILGGFLTRLGAFPVDRENTGLSTLRHSMKILKENHILGIFPEGTRVKKKDLKNAKPGVALISIQTRTPIIPIFIDTTYKPFSKIRVVVGEKINFFDIEDKLTRDDYKLLGEKVLEEIYKLN